MILPRPHLLQPQPPAPISPLEPSGSEDPSDLFRELFGSEYGDVEGEGPELEPLDEGDGGEDFAAAGVSAINGSAMGKVTHRMSRKGPEAPDEPIEPPPLPPPTEVPPIRTRMLTLGTPLRSKKVRDVLPAIQGIINRLTAAGFPVNRYHSDRAGEFRARPLVMWLKNQGIHATWAPAETLQGNRAELG